MTFSAEYRGGTVTGESKDLVDEFIKQDEEQRALRARWPWNEYEAMNVLARSFPTMRELECCNPFNAMGLVRWLNSGAAGSGSRHAAMFLLMVWNVDTDWRKEGLKVKAGEGRFHLGRAIASWDMEHRRAALAWVEAPFFP